ncbi:thiamine biosynthesis lipoprotein [Shewanella chilikensis]|uniref:FAD:protein FMN transferase n=2 Tax=Shewanella chilikensis TaxID=558541 RepID=A0ABX5PL96_9GAMM|nr:thiamine biosynthesis lipoprotein [Shewanella chilikensis]GGZ44965.1 FAD:protein FMN transferase [Shewanella chilikensis]
MTKSHTSAPEMSLSRTDFGFRGRFRAMASPCELLIASCDERLALSLTQAAIKECQRLEQKYSRFLTGNWLWQLNHSAGAPVMLDSEAAALLQFAKRCWQLSEGLFDITAGPLLALWCFEKGKDSETSLPSSTDIKKALSWVGFQHLKFSSHFDDRAEDTSPQEITEPPWIMLPEAMQLDFGGLVKEYAADRVAELCMIRAAATEVLVNLGGDIAVSGKKCWQVGIEDPANLDRAAELMSLDVGALATSGDSRRFIEHQGRRFGHILDPRSGYPVQDAPHSVTVKAASCITAGMLATLAMLKGAEAEDFLKVQQLEHRIIR